MHPTDHSTPRPAWEERPAFRELFLLHLPPPAAAALRQAGRYLYDAFLEQDLYELPEPWVRARVRALAEDLRFTGQVLASLGAAPVEAGLSRAESALAQRAEGWAVEIAVLTAAIEGALGGTEGAP